ncbi:MAG TPA: TonB-dependent receptor plug domain-containing protein [Sphingomicrobium sp.]|nr:TonB-dependent receptor plug domain-containing protein [Sphingomicrobium sp.]
MRSALRIQLLAGASLLAPAGVLAQTVPPTSDPAVVPAPVATPVAGKRVYTPADFARFAPKTAYDMLVQVPGFTIRSADNERGLGQASENVLVNGQRIVNKSYGGGAGGATEELQRTPIGNVERIEIVDAASLGIAGLSGQVANVIMKETKGASGQFEWRPDFRAHYSKPNLFRGNISYSGKSGPVDYTLSVNNQAGRGAFGGPIIITDRDGNLLEERNEIYHSESDLVTFQTKFGLDGPGSSIGHLTLGYTPYWAPTHIRDTREFVTGEIRNRSTVAELDGWYYDVNADYEFALGPGRLKLIGTHHFDHEPVITTQVLHFDSDDHDEGVRFSRDSRIKESIGRGEYRWHAGKNDWQMTFERAFNSLDQRGGLFTLSPEGEFEEVDYPEGTGKVTEVRYEGIASLSRPLSSKLDLQLAGGGEISHLDRVDDDQPARKFFRPKGSLTLGWRPAEGLDASLKVSRRVGQISFYDFLSQPKLADDRENAGNPDLVPPQSWEFETELSKDLGAWGKTKLRTYYHLIDDIIDIIPLANHTEGVGNLPHATRYGAESTSTINLDPIGFVGAKIDLTLGTERTSVEDPLTGEDRSISGTRNRWAYISLRHDIPHTDWAWGGEADYEHYTREFYLTEVSRSWEGPWFVSAYVENKDVFGMTVRAQVGNIFNARHRWTRYIYEDWRDSSEIDQIQRNNQLIGPIFSFMVKGTF